MQRTFSVVMTVVRFINKCIQANALSQTLLGATGGEAILMGDRGPLVP